MKKLSLTLVLLVGATSISIAQSGAGSEQATKKVNTEKTNVVTEKKPAKEVKSVRTKNIQMAPVKSKEAIIEEKKTNQK